MQGKTHMAAAAAISLGIITYKTQDFGMLQSGVLIVSTIALTMILPSGIRPYGITFEFEILLGYASHIILDMLTPKGSPVLNPISKYSVSLLRIKTGGVIEFMIRMAMYILVIYMGWMMVSPIISDVLERLPFLGD